MEVVAHMVEVDNMAEEVDYMDFHKEVDILLVEVDNLAEAEYMLLEEDFEYLDMVELEVWNMVVGLDNLLAFFLIIIKYI